MLCAAACYGRLSKIQIFCNPSSTVFLASGCSLDSQPETRCASEYAESEYSARRSATETSNSPANNSSVAKEGSVAPRSNLEIDSGSNFIRSAKWACVHPSCFLRLAILRPSRCGKSVLQSVLSTICVAKSRPIWLCLRRKTDRMQYVVKFQHIVLLSQSCSQLKLAKVRLVDLL